MARASLIYQSKRLFDDGWIVEMTLWQLPHPVPGSRHSFKYSLFYGRSGERVVGYDNESGKGDHRHYGDREEAYGFTSPERLMADFLGDVQRLRSTNTGEAG